MMVYKITSYQGCHLEASDGLFGEGSLLFPPSEDEQIIGQPWDFQRKHDTTKFLKSTQSDEAWVSEGVLAGSCDV